MATAVATGGYDQAVFYLLSCSLFLVQLIFLALGILVSAIAKKIKSVLPISLGTVFGLFIVSMLGSTIGDDKLRYITPFKYYDSSYILQNASYETSFVVIELVFLVAAITVSYLLYARKDINPV